MTREEILAMEPGRNLNALVATNLMGWELTDVHETVYDIEGRPEGGSLWRDDEGDAAWLPDYSNSLTAAWEVEELMSDDMGKYVKALCDVVGTPRDGTRLFASDDWRLIHASPSDRCKAALLAVLGEEEV